MIFSQSALLFSLLVCVASGTETSIDEEVHKAIDKGHLMKAPTMTRSLKATKATKATKAISMKATKGSGKKGPPSNLVAFGDSLSDTGNANQFYPFNTGAFYGGDRFSNGPLLLEQIATQLDIDVSPWVFGGNNFAFVGATAAPFGDGNDFQSQVGRYEATNPTITPETLYFIWLGGNDVIRSVNNMSRNNLAETEANLAMLDAVDAIKTNIQRLIDNGACSFLVLGSLDLGLAPRTYFTAFPQSSTLSELFNKELKDMLRDLKYEVSDNGNCLGLKYVDVAVLVDERREDEDYVAEFPDPTSVCNYRFIVNATEGGVCNEPCPFVMPTLPIPFCPEPGDCCNCRLPVLPEEFVKKDPADCAGNLFFDELHPTTQFNGYLADAVLEEAGKFLHLDD